MTVAVCGLNIRDTFTDWSHTVISEHRLGDVKDQIADMADSPVALLLVGVVPLCIVTYMQVKGSIGMGMKIKVKDHDL